MAETVERHDCDARHEAAEKLLDEKFASFGKDLAGIETRIKLWVMIGIIPFLIGLGGQLVCMGQYQERVDRTEQRIDKIEPIVNDLYWQHEAEKRRTP